MKELAEIAKKQLCQIFEIDDIASKTMEQDYVFARMIFCKYFTDLGMPLKRCATYIGLKHPAVYNMKRRYDDNYETNRYFRTKADRFNKISLYELLEKDTETHLF